MPLYATNLPQALQWWRRLNTENAFWHKIQSSAVRIRLLLSERTHGPSHSEGAEPAELSGTQDSSWRETSDGALAMEEEISDDVDAIELCE